MKINKAKMMVTTLAIAATAATVGSISGTVAWFQYNTRVTAAYVGTSASTTGNLQIKIGTGEYKSDLTSSDIATYLTGAGNNTQLHPITYSAGLAADGALTASNFKSHPVYQYFAYSAWADAVATDYVVLPIKVKYQTVDSTPAALSGKDVWLSDLTIQNHSGVSGDLYKALRVHVNTVASNNLLSAEADTVTLGGALDLNNDGQDDIDDSSLVHYDFQPAGSAGTYGDDTKSLVSVAASSLYPTDDGKGALSDGSPLGQTDSNGELAINVTIWLEGWAELTSGKTLKGTVADIAARDALSASASTGDIYKVTDAGEGTPAFYEWNGTAWVATTDPTATSSMWDVSYIGKQFDIGLRFSTSTL